MTQVILAAQFVAGATLAWGVAEFWLGNMTPLFVAGAATLIVHAISWRRRGQIRGVWLTALGLCGFLSKVDPDLSMGALGDLRAPVIVGGSILALGYGFLIEERSSLGYLLGRSR